MIKNAVARLNAQVEAETQEANWNVEKTYYQFGTGLMAVIAMAVYPIVFQLNGFKFAGAGLNFWPTVAAIAMGAVLIFAWSIRFTNDRANMKQFKKNQLENFEKLATALNNTGSVEGFVEVDTSTKTPQLVVIS
jgi:uncharacterized membrane protein